MKGKKDNPKLKVNTNLVVMPKGVFLLFGVGMFLLGDMEACSRINKKTLKKVLGADKEEKGSEAYSYSRPGFKNKEDAEDVLERLTDLALEYGYASVADLRDMCEGGGVGTFEDSKWGWTKSDLNKTYLKSVDGEEIWVLKFPDPKKLR